MWQTYFVPVSLDVVVLDSLSTVLDTDNKL